MSTSPATFYQRVDKAIGSPALQAAVRNATFRMSSGRDAAVAAFPEMDVVRDHARAIRAHTIARLDHYLREFEANIQRRGGHVHWAATSEEAVAIVVDIARQHGVKTVVKGKSMVSEEIELNPGLARAGVQVLETDLGEYIVQLDDDHPSHIVMPIIHKSRQDVARLFRAKLQATDDEVADAPRMAALARRVLRKGFLQADMGISGGNFGVAATGSVCITTNEGNGRLTTSLPRVHVALMGIERIVPTLDDLGVMLQVLGRSATGQKLTVYSNVMSGPRRHGRDGGAGESDGPEHFHVVLVDNGRSTLVGLRARRDPLLHPLRRVPQQLPRVSADGRARLRQHLSRPGWRGADACAAGPAPVARPAAGQQPVRRVQRGLPGPHRHPAHAARASRQDDAAGADADLGDVRAHRVSPDRDPPGAVPARAGPGQLGDATAGHRRVDQVAAGSHGALVEEARFPRVCAQDVPAAVGGAQAMTDSRDNVLGAVARGVRVGTLAARRVASSIRARRRRSTGHRIARG